MCNMCDMILDDIFRNSNWGDMGFSRQYWEKNMKLYVDGKITLDELKRRFDKNEI